MGKIPDPSIYVRGKQMKEKTFERAIHKWDDWHDSIERSRKLLGYDPKWPEQESITWIESNIASIRKQGENELKRLELPPTLQQYWEDCFYSDYRDKNGNVNLSKITRRLSEFKSLPSLPCDYGLVWYDDENIDDPWLRVELRIHSRFVVKELLDRNNKHTRKSITRELLEYASKNAFMTLEDALLWKGTKPHPLCQWLKGGRPPINEERALECARLADEQGMTEVDIGKRFKWAFQEDSYGKRTQCRTARRYIQKGRQLKETGRT